VQKSELINCLEQNPVIAAIGEDKWEDALAAPVQVLFYLSANLLTVEQYVRQAHEAGKFVLVHLDLAEGIGRDRVGMQYLAGIGVDGVISTKAQMIHLAKEQGLLTVQRFFLLDSLAFSNLRTQVTQTRPDVIEVLPALEEYVMGVIDDAVARGWIIED